VVRLSLHIACTGVQLALPLTLCAHADRYFSMALAVQLSGPLLNTRAHGIYIKEAPWVQLEKIKSSFVERSSFPRGQGRFS
jgi:hypothetical protein